MQVTVRLFAGLREVAGSDSLTEDFEASSITVELLRERLTESHPKLAPYMSGVAVAVNEEYILEPGSELKDGDTVALIPPISGGATRSPRVEVAPRFLLTSDELDSAGIRAAVITPASGAYVLFEGVVRDHHDGRAVERLEYEAYEGMAVREMEKVATEVLEEFDGREVHAIAIHHRTGVLEVGEVSLLVAVTAAHRRDAFEAGLRTVDRVKETLPVWKKEWGPDGSQWQEGVSPQPRATQPSDPRASD